MKKYNKKLSETIRNCNKEEIEYDSEEELQEALRRSLLDTGNIAKEPKEKKKKMSKTRDKKKSIYNDLATLEENDGEESYGFMDEEMIMKDLEEIEERGRVDDEKQKEAAVKKDLA